MEGKIIFRTMGNVGLLRFDAYRTSLTSLSPITQSRISTFASATILLLLPDIDELWYIFTFSKTS